MILMRKLILFVAALLGAVVALGQTKSDLEFIEQTLESRGEIVLQFPHNGNRDLVHELGHIISIDNVNDTFVQAYANRNEYEQFKTYGIQYAPAYEYYRQTRALNMATTVDQMANWDRYPTYPVYLQMMQNYANTYPDLCRLVTNGQSVSGKDIVTLVISDNVNVDEDEPEFWWSSTMHGDETTGWYFMLRLIDYLLTNYGTDEQATRLVNNIEIHISPNTNPDGTFYRSNDGTSMANGRRYNQNGVDLNRNFPFINGTASNGNQPEITMMTAYADAHNFVMAANGHGGSECLNYPWDEDGWTHARRPNADDDWWLYVCNQYANTVHAINSRILTGPSDVSGANGITKGSEWYSIDGGRQDYMNYYHHCKEITMEWSSTKMLGTENLNNYWNYHRQAILDYTEQVLFGFNGIVSDACTGTPLGGVNVFINNHDTDNTDVYTSNGTGDYHRPIYGGTYSVTFSKDGYRSQTINVTTQTGTATRLDVSLYPESALNPDFVADNTIVFEGDAVNYTNTTSGNYTTQTWTFEGGSPSTSTNASPTTIYQSAGTYDVTLSLVSQEGCLVTTTKENYIIVNAHAAPTADFEADQTYISEGSAISFTDLSTNVPTSWSWTFEGGTPATSNEQNPTVTYSTPGIYQVSLTVTNEYGSDTKTKTEYITVTYPEIIMSNETIYVCGATYKDPGGDNDYSNNSSYTQTIYPSTDNALVRLTFNQFSLESSSGTRCYDKFYIYDGTSDSDAVLVDGVCGSNNPGTVTATNAAGALTIKFTSDYSTVDLGWEAEISCYMPGPVVAVQNYTPTTTRFRTTTDLNVTFVNIGSEASGASTSATLSTDDEYITLNTTTAVLGTMARNATVNETFNFTVEEDVPDGHVATINAAITDGSISWYDTITISIVGPSCEAPTGLQVALNGSDATITWDTVTITPITISDDFEDHTAFTINSPGTVGWTYIDGDGKTPGRISNYSFTNSQRAMAYIVFNPSLVTSTQGNGNLSSSITAHSGDQFLADFYSSSAANNDWIISPELNYSEDFNFSFYCRGGHKSYDESYEVYYSTTTNEQSAFTNLLESGTANGGSNVSWEQKTYTVPATAKYVAIRCTSNNKYYFCIDDITISGNYIYSTTAVNIYDNGTLIASNVTSGTYTASDLTAGEHCFSIRAVCDDDTESLTSQSCVTVTDNPANYTINVTASDGGSVTPSGTLIVFEGEDFTFTATANDCYQIDSATVDEIPILSIDGLFTISNISDDHNVNVTFSQISYNVTANAGEGGTIAATTTAACGEDFTFTVEANACYQIENVTVNGVSVNLSGNSYTINNVSSDQVINATFSQISYNVTASAGEGGTIAAATTAACGENFTFTVEANACYQIENVTVNGVSVNLSGNSNTINNVSSDQVINATFSQISYNVTASAGEGGTIAAATTATCGENFTFTVEASACHQIENVTVNGVSVNLNGNSYTVENVASDLAIEAVFSTITYTITATAGDGGSITPEGDVEVTCGTDITFIISANDGFAINDVTVDGTSMGAIESYTFANVTEDGHTIIASFIENTPECYSVTNLTAHIESYGVVLSWTAAENSVSYDIYRNGERIASLMDTTAIDLDGHAGDTYYIITNCGNGTSDPSESITATEEAICNTVTDFDVTIESYGIVLSWTAAENAVSYDIYRNGERIASQIGTTAIDPEGHEGDTYYIISDCEFGTSDPTESITAQITGIAETATQTTLFPNPANNILNISSSETISCIEFVSITGQVISRIEVNGETAICNIENLAQGMYFVRIYGTINASIPFCQKKFVKE